MNSATVARATAPFEASTGPCSRRLRAKRRSLSPTDAPPTEGCPCRSSRPPAQCEAAPHEDIGSESDCAHRDTSSQTLAGTAIRCRSTYTARYEITRPRSVVSNHVCLPHGLLPLPLRLLEVDRLIHATQHVPLTQHRLDPACAEFVPGERARTEPLL